MKLPLRPPLVLPSRLVQCELVEHDVMLCGFAVVVLHQEAKATGIERLFSQGRSCYLRRGMFLPHGESHPRVIGPLKKGLQPTRGSWKDRDIESILTSFGKT